MKYFVAFVLLWIGIICVQCATVPSGANVQHTWGQRQLYDQRIHYQIINHSKSFLKKNVEDVAYPAKGVFGNGNITSIIATNQLGKDGSSVTLLKGGVGFSFTTLHFKSGRGEPMSYILEIYGRH